ncbi:(d)CMP kinase [Candidatus Desulforudis audaxviator]|uniref:Cytidylate kinase n=1 Tax=Desulforudis audaxviator (strain MP104C) TaxID=477974 RepID=B1I3Y9_DESAP|nr:(d)CMP kinase [Candidatus Desulforudis audaxviator]ACA59691.1 cytidylate kinase [Candidatus Desulforudis audaxviator MP104C]
MPGVQKGAGAIRRGVIAIDGPAGAGKSTVAKRVADSLGFAYVDTGAMYRGITLLGMRTGIAPSDSGEKLTELVRSAELKFEAGSGGLRVYLNGEDVTRAIREPDVSRQVSYYARIPSVRQVLTLLQRELAVADGIVMEGRDIGTAVLPDAEHKFFVTATPLERAKRRLKELNQEGYRLDLDQLVREIEERDRIDSSRSVAPLCVAPDAVVIDTTDLTVDEVVAMIVAKVGNT